MATLAAMLKRKGLDVQGSDQDVYPPMSDFLAAEGIRTLVGYQSEHIDRRSRSRRRRQRDLARQSRARRGARSEDPLLLAAGSDSRAFSLGRPIDRHRRHARQDHDHGADRVAADARRPRSRACWSAASRAISATTGSSYRIGQGRDFVIEGDEYDSAFFDKTAKFLKYLPDIAVINNVEFDHADIYADFDAVTLAFRRLVNLVPRRGLLLLGADSPGARALVDAAVSRVETFGTADDADWQAHDLAPAGARPASRCGVPAHPSARSRCRWSARTTCATRWRRSRSPPRSASGRSASPTGCARLPASSGGSRSLAWPTASRSTTTSRTIRRRSPRRSAGLRASHPEARIWAVFEPRSASSCRRVFQDDFARAFGAADEVLIAPVFRSTLPEAERLSRSAAGARPPGAGPVGPRRRVDRRHRRDYRIGAPAGRPGGVHVERRIRRHSSEAAAGARVSGFRIVPAGDAALMVEFEERIDPEVNARAIAVAEAIQAAAIAGVRDIVPTYRSVAVYFDPLRTDHDALTDCLEGAAAVPSAPAAVAERVSVLIPVCYGGEFGPDLAGVAAFADVTEDEVVRVHVGRTYRVFMLGFVPGFAYLGIVDQRIAMPRHATPRVRVPAGSVGIAGVQTGIYPAETPGGWQLIGRTPLKPFDPARADPFL